MVEKMKIDQVKHISTKTGDKGTSANYDNVRYLKDDILFETLGTIDELSSHLGLVYQITKINDLKQIQQNLQDINSLIATSNVERRQKLRQLREKDIEFLELLEETHLKEAHITHEFVLPGSESLESAYFDIARTITRRSERRLVSFIQTNQRTDLQMSLQYINRLSDLLFIMARKKR